MEFEVLKRCGSADLGGLSFHARHKIVTNKIQFAWSIHLSFIDEQFFIGMRSAR
jgi:hypothetical protein